jgi:hypothetical protein
VVALVAGVEIGNLLVGGGTLVVIEDGNLFHGSAFYAKVPGVRLKPRDERLALRSFGHRPEEERKQQPQRLHRADAAVVLISLEEREQ